LVKKRGIPKFEVGERLWQFMQLLVELPSKFKVSERQWQVVDFFVEQMNECKVSKQM